MGERNMQMEQIPMQSFTSEPPECLATCKIFIHTLDEANGLKESYFTVADLNQSNSESEFSSQTSFRGDPKDHKLRWIHIPANNMSWVESFMEKWFHGSSNLDDKMWKFKVRPGLPHPENKPLHSRHMEPSCTIGEDSNPTASRQPGNIQAHELGVDYNSMQRQGKNTEQSKEPEKPLLALYVNLQPFQISRCQMTNRKFHFYFSFRI